MQLEEDIDFTTLGWVKPQIDETLLQARQALEAYVEDPADASLMRFCATYLHQVQGTLRMVELYGAAMLTEEMEALAQALLDDKAPDRDEAYTVLMRGLVQLPDYLERVQAGNKDIPVVLLPLLNELRRSRAEAPLGESALFAPNLEHALPPDVPGARVALPFGDLRQRVTAVRARFQTLLATWLRAPANADFNGMRQVLDQLGAVSHTLPARRLWWIASGVLEALQEGKLDERSIEAIKQQFGRVDRAIKAMQDEGEAALADEDRADLNQSLLYLLAQAKPGAARCDAIRKTYSLDALLPSAEELEQARGSMSGRNRVLLDTVSQALKEDLLRVKEALDIFLRREGADAAELEPHIETLHRVGDTLGMLGLGVPRRVVSEQREVLEAVAHGQRPAAEDTLMDVAGALLFVDASLDDHIERIGAPADEPAEPEAMPRAEARKVVDALMREAATNLSKVKEDIVAFIESPWAHDRVLGVPALLDEVSGALRMLDMPRPAELLGGIGRFVDNELIADRRIPTAEQMDTLADAMAGVEYYLEAARDSRGGGERILAGTQRSLESLGYWPVPARREAAERPAPAAVSFAAPDLSEAVSIAAGSDMSDLIVGATQAPAPSAQDLAGLNLVETQTTAQSQEGKGEGEWVEVEEEVEEPVAGDAGAAHFQDAAGIDEDIREVFVEEVGEEIASIRQHLPAWKADPENLDALKSVRRSFHTLKGSGRLVGAMALGEFSWKVENMLNRVLDRTIPPDANVQAVVDHALAALPDLHAALQGGEAPRAPLAAIMQAADKLAAGEPARVEDFMQTHKVRRMVRRWVARASEVEQVPQATLAAIAPAVEAPAPQEPVFAGPVLPPVDPMLLEILRSEVAQHLSTMRDYIAHGGAPQPIDDAMVRAAHTLHGAVAMVDIPVLAAVLTPLESWFKRMRAARAAPDAEGIAALRDSVALTDHVIAQFDAPEPEVPDSTALAERLARLRDTLPEATLADVLHMGDEEEVPAAIALESAADVPVEEPVHAEEITQAPAAEEAAQEFPPEPESVFAGESESGESAAVASFLQGIAAEAVAPAPDTQPADAEAERAVGQAEMEHFAAETAAAQRLEAERAEAERIAAEQREAEERRVAAERAEFERAEAERFAAEQAALEAERQAEQARAAEMERLAAERAEAERIERERIAAEQAEADRLEQERIVAEQAEAARLAAELEAERLEQERIAAEKAEAERVEAERIAEERRQRAVARAMALAAMPPFPDDPQPEGKLDLPDIDPDLLEIFTQEGTELLDHSDGLLATLRDAPEDREPVVGLQRDLHTLKGGARVAGIAEIGDLAHVMETLLEAIAEGRREVDALIVESLERGFDRLNDLVQRVVQGKAVATPVNAIARFEQLSSGKVAAAELAAAPADEPEQANVEPVAASAAGEPRKEKIAPRAAPSFEEEARAPQEMIRVRSDLLDSLVNYAGEVSIYRSRLEQQVSNFRFNLVELDQTVARLRTQLRSLEIETEAQILSRYQRENEGHHETTFDPLELDRFSQLQQYSRALAESVSDLVSIQGILDDQARQSETLLLQQSRVSSDLQEGLMRTRMVPFESMVPSLRRTLRQAAMDLGKRAQLRVEGAQGEMDRNLLERMKAPFEHMLRNALAHGIEDPDSRIESGKPEEGTVAINVSREATEVLIKVTDDGAGFDRDAIRAKAIERGLLKPEVQLSDRDLYAFVMETGFSTAESVTQIAGRGVGMDVVANEIKLLGGTLSIDSERGRGSSFNIRLPFTLAVTQAIMVRTGETIYAVPMTSIQGVARIQRAELEKRIAAGNPSFTYAGEEYGIHDLSQLLGLPAVHAVEEGQLPLLMIRTGDLRAAVRIDAVVGSREIVVKSVGPQISSVPGIFGATIMGDGSVMLILDIAPLVRRVIARQQVAAEMAEAPQLPSAELEERPRPLVMVVDDSITMRKVTSRVLERNDYEVITAKDGLDAVEKLIDRVPDLMLLDIEMPRMDGYELATHMKNDPRLASVPIIMITSRTGEKHRQRAFEIGVERYLGKPYNEAELLRNVQEMLETTVHV
ncbi:MAG TPA: Hpt domain-containing protein [Rhodanobacteraceae bacterium]|nr:Hpt domain-containing protein [Rhodanobacteraceae bacterium]